ncbi:cytochrome P450 [Punctularia strigosozonata HHB-11173 SS5]|uniref:cytochrome P450 n=1 Tax=Punctularia strigosozonata (strain HHB-11173) TaxID=741275 RepID=UPI00044167BC|nr:cytochrome P450 [Punctularia strigosozonata HHB-11173 SS5]EIN05321.1 cytochrome P450 [Punctularia strigosozonata HHB-11173 SS5]
MLGVIGISAFVLALWGTWRMYKRVVVKSVLRNLPGPPSPSLFVGNFRQIWDTSGFAFHQQLGDMGSAVKVHGFFGDEHIYLTDPRALHHVLVKDQDVFEESAHSLETSRLLFGNGLVASLGKYTRPQRKMLNPLFSPAHLRTLVPTFFTITEQLRRALTRHVEGPKSEIDILEWCSRAALEYIGVGGLGYSFDALKEGAANIYSESAKNLFPSLFPIAPLCIMLPYISAILPPGLGRKIIDAIPFPSVRTLKSIVDMMDETSKEIYERKKQAIMRGEGEEYDQVAHGKDIMTTLLRANMASAEKDRLPEDQLLGQMNLLIFAAYDTTSSALARILHLLSGNPQLQDELRQEIRGLHVELANTLPSYEQLMSLPLLDSIIRETLRLYAPVPFVQRTSLNRCSSARKDIVIPLRTPTIGVDGTAIHELPIKNNQGIFVGMAMANRNKALWGPDALEWKPGRWLEPLPDSVTDAHIPGVYSNQLTFLGGSRACIGFKFSELEMKAVIYMLIHNFKFEQSKSEIVWRLGNVMVPSVKGQEDAKPHLPLIITPLLSSEIDS